MMPAPRRVTAVLTSVGCVAAVVLGLVTATGAASPAVALASSGHWVVNFADNTVVHVDGGTAQVDAKVELPEDVGDPLFALQGEQQGFVVTREKVAVFGRSTLTVDTTIPLGFDEVPVGIETVGGPYLVYRTAGTIVRLGLPPLSLPIGGPVARPVWTDDGTVWVQRTDDGSFCALRAGVDVLDCSAGAAPGEPGGLSITGAVPAFVGTRRDAAQVVTASLGSPVALGADVAEAALLADRDTEGRLAVVEPGVNRLVLTDSGGVPAGRDGGAAILVDLGPGEFSSPLAANGVIAVLDLVGNRLLTFDATGRRLGDVALPPGDDPVLTRGADGAIYVDDADGATTHVVAPDGTVTSVATGGRLPDTVAVAAPPERISPVQPPPTRRPPSGGTARLPGPQPPGQPLPGPGPVPSVAPVVSPAPPPPPVPAPIGVTARVQGESIVVTWQPVNGNQVSYRVRANGGAPRETAALSMEFGGLPAGEPITFRVSAVVNGVEGPQSAPTDPEEIVGRAAPPTNLAAVLVGGGTHTDDWSVTWQQPDLNGGDFVRYLVSEGNGGGTARATPDHAMSMLGCTISSISVQAVTSSATDDDVVGEEATLDVGADQDCTIVGEVTAYPDEDGRTVNLYKDLRSDAGFVNDVPCSATANGQRVWTGTCSADQYRGAQFAQFEGEYDTTYDIVLSIEPATPASSPASLTTVVTTGSGPDCTTDPPPAGC